jgi:hypothetical protein
MIFKNSSTGTSPFDAAGHVPIGRGLSIVAEQWFALAADQFLFALCAVQLSADQP